MLKDFTEMIKEAMGKCAFVNKFRINMAQQKRPRY